MGVARLNSIAGLKPSLPQSILEVSRKSIISRNNKNDNNKKKCIMKILNLRLLNNIQAEHGLFQR